ncbi:hypothetical protein Pmar_PMAR027864 [Perkinsus marinus ATCC 50983]|uniref:Glycogenin-1 n=1 Tax=Perkinsus marinus (strain ATCC 50983 / TXsc) TaxID=423536 RepID=C5LD91_PERM5|nr:hypothetical protein Pmar_PMAR027864 [Perkinsus marinus ATCC 50983]EER05223.1 hypothetical protein Pmar_PMAR027864 [Perkinsus marinus ATCC 50983]|eukprot:XP_002773407.1 hypothetical protein Pmar_PMAR027864 [Perkinsus marinus ATCC 50983]
MSDPPPHPDVCVATLVMGDVSYIAGAMVMAHSVRRHCAKSAVPFHLVCIVDRSMADVEALRCVFDNVIQVDPILAEPMGKRWKRYGGHYDSWIDSCLTKLHVFNLYKLGYQKVVFVDADVLVVDDLFARVLTAPAPSGICSDEANKLDGKEGRLRALKTGDKVPAASLRRALALSYGMRGCLMVLPTGAKHFRKCLDRVAEKESQKDGYVGRCGDPKCNAGPDEWLLSLHFQDKWRHLEEAFCCRYWHAQTRGITPLAIHFVTDKPWSRRSDKQWPDFDIWLDYARGCLSSIQAGDRASKLGRRLLNDAVVICEERRRRLVPELREARVGSSGLAVKGTSRVQDDDVEAWFRKRIDSSSHTASVETSCSRGSTRATKSDPARKKQNRRRRASRRRTGGSSDKL